MKQKTLLKSFLLLALIFTFSSVAQASEVTGNLSSTTVADDEEQGGGGSSGSSSSGSRGTSSGSENTENPAGVGSVLENPTFATNSNGTFSSDGTAFGPGEGNLALEDGTLTTTTAEPTMSSGLVATALGGFGDFSATSWFWIVFLLLLLIAFFIYIYKRPLKKDNTVRT